VTTHKYGRKDVSRVNTTGFWDLVMTGEEAKCWPWSGHKADTGYGRFGTCYAHRIAWYLTNGTIPEGFYVCHRCDNRLCCNPGHLFLGTHQDNVSDMVNKRRHAHGVTSGQSKLSPSRAEGAIFVMALGLNQREAGELFGLTQSHMSLLWRGCTGWTKELLPSEYCEDSCCSFEGELQRRRAIVDEYRTRGNGAAVTAEDPRASHR
jgi:hypothetical protein